MNLIQVIRIIVISCGLIIITINTTRKVLKQKVDYTDGFITGMWFVIILNNIIRLIEGE